MEESNATKQDPFLCKQLSETADSEQVYDTILKWITTCRDSHDECKTLSSSSFVPSRLVDTGPLNSGHVNDHLRIVSHDQISQPPPTYAALSYCWGNGKSQEVTDGTQRYETTPDNLSEREISFSLHHLPQTLRDAVAIVRKLGIRYLWVDALCILQGPDAESRADWEVESAVMDRVYGRAVLTIAAASAAAAHDGILHERSSISSRPAVATTMKPRKIQLTLKDINIGPGVPGPPRETAAAAAGRYAQQEEAMVWATNERMTDCLDEPLYHRAWTLQERILSQAC